MRKAWRMIAFVVARTLAWAGDSVGDVLTLIGLALLAIGLWQLSHAAALIVPGGILVWYALPSRPPFITKRSSIGQRRDVS